MQKVTDDETIRRLLMEGDWFSGLAQEHRDYILEESTVRRFADGEVICPEDVKPLGLFAVLEGQVRLVRHVGDGRQILYHVAEPGFWFSELALLRDDLTAVTSISRGQGRVLLLPLAKFRSRANSFPDFFQACARMALHRYAILLRYLAQAQWLPPEDYLKVRLADLVELHQQDRKMDGPVELAVSQAELATMIGTSRQTVNALLQRLEEDGLIEVTFQKIRILDGARLRGGRRKTGL